MCEWMSLYVLLWSVLCNDGVSGNNDDDGKGLHKLDVLELDAQGQRNVLPREMDSILR
jgi:hypothetical protein